MSEPFGHIPVMLNEVVDALAIRPAGVYIDGTLGRCGHSGAVLKRLGPQGKLLGFDKDLDAIHFAQAQYGQDRRFSFVHSSFADMKSEIENRDWLGKVDGLLLDLGVSSNQLDESERGFSFMRSGDLDMRMNQLQEGSAADWIRTASEEEMIDIFRRYGEEKFSKRIARKIVESRELSEIKTTGQLAGIVASAVPGRREKKHPATRVFQAIRIHVNNELGDLETVLDQMSAILAPGGRLAVLSFHSLEDRIVKQFMRRVAGKNGDQLPDLPVMEKQRAVEFELVKAPKKATNNEQSQNPRSRSAILRVAQRTSFTSH